MVDRPSFGMRPCPGTFARVRVKCTRMAIPAATSARKNRRRGLSVVEVLAVCVVVAAVSFTVVRSGFREEVFLSEPALEEMESLKKYGPTRYSRDLEEWIIRDHFQDKRDGIFLDVGANHFRNDSNTYYLETALGWSGLAIDAVEEFAADYKLHRPRTQFVAMFASDRAGSVQLFVPEHNKLVASSDPDFIKKHGETGAARQVPATTLNDALAQAGIARLDFMSMDIELAEPKALAGFDIHRFKPALVCIEGHPEVRQQILEYFARHRYVLAGKYLRADVHNLYFQPAAEGPASR
jgi:FkbM family methyltransferase